MEILVTKIDAATEQMDRAIRLFLDHQAYLPAITLAGAAEEIVGCTLGDKSTFVQLRTKFVNDLGLAEKVVSQDHLNKVRNWLKHWNEMKDADTLAIDLQEEAIQYIGRALANLAAHDQSMPSEGPRFIDWLTKNRRWPSDSANDSP